MKKKLLVVWGIALTMLFSGASAYAEDKQENTLEGAVVEDTVEEVDEEKEEKYQDGIQAMKEDRNEDAIKIFTELEDYKESKERLEICNTRLDKVKNSDIPEEKQIVEDGDIVNVDFDGYLDGKPYNGASTDGMGIDIRVGYHEFIEEFEEAMLGHKVGETFDFDLEVTDYQNASVEEINVVMTIHYIEEKAPERSEDDYHHVEIDVEDYGTIKIELDAYSAPITVANFMKLAEEGFYNGLTFHRIMDGFMMQGGDPLGNGTGGSEETIKGEFMANGVPNRLSHTKGAVSMARSQMMDSASSQFFIVQTESKFLDGQYAVFGYVTEGLEIVDMICADAKPTDDNGTIPKEEQPVITEVRVID